MKYLIEGNISFNIFAEWDHMSHITEIELSIVIERLSFNINGLEFVYSDLQ